MYKKIKKMNKYQVIFFANIACLLFLIINLAFAEDKTANFNKTIAYDIYYNVSKCRVDIVRDVRIAGILSIEGKTFLVIKGTGFASEEKEGYILLDTIKAILPSKFIEPKISSSNKKMDSKIE
ncbi:MAG: hypothetical protein HZA27_02060 [Candidatus Omnitrophica bacterium]|nr:hypothetical protein [Candidatus Omnitrophota bacterium]MBI5144953.1 hypothetical protein [Candidatus Omnitrophota bacterium]